MAREDVEFKTVDGVALRGWFYRPDDAAEGEKLPCLVMAHGKPRPIQQALDDVGV